MVLNFKDLFNILEVQLYTVPKVIDFLRYNMQCSGEHVILRGIFHVVSGFPVYISCYIAEIWIAYLTVYSYGGAIQYTVEGENEGKNDNTVCTVITVVAISLERDKSLERLTLHAYFLHLKLKI